MLARVRLLGLLTLLYLAQGLPQGFFGNALPAYLRAGGASRLVASATTLLALPWSLKPLWAPLCDRHYLPRVGRRRTWIVAGQLGIAASAAVAALLELGSARVAVFGAVVVINLFAATQDLATDAFAVETLPLGDRGWGNGLQVAGYKVGMLLGGGALLMLGAARGWSFMVGALGVTAAALALVAWVGCAPRDAALEARARSAPGSMPAALRALWARPDGRAMLLLAVVYKLGVFIAAGVGPTLLKDLGYGLEGIGRIRGVYGLGAGALGSLLGGALVVPLGRRRALVGFALLECLPLGALGLACAGEAGASTIAALVVIEQAVHGFMTAGLFTVLMAASRPEAAASEFSLLTTGHVLATGLGGLLGGFVGDRVGYGGVFTLAAATTLAGSVAALALLRPAPAARPLQAS